MDTEKLNRQDILLVEDDPQDVELMLLALEEHQLANRVAVVRDGAEALDYLYRRGKYELRAGVNPMVVLLDNKMPKLSGLEVLKTIKADEHLQTIPVVMLTSSRETPDLNDFYKHGVNAYVLKPVDFSEYMKVVEHLGVFWGGVNEAPSLPWKALPSPDDVPSNTALEHLDSDLLPADSTVPAFATDQPSAFKAAHTAQPGEPVVVLRATQTTADLVAVMRRTLEKVDARAKRQRLEARYIEAQKVEVLGELAGGVVHDFNNFLAVIIGYSEMIEAKLGPNSSLREYTDQIRLASQGAAGLTRQLLVFSREETVLPLVLDLNDVVQDMEKMLRRLIGEHIAMTMVPGKQTGRVKTDPGYVGQLLMNLVVNARDAMPRGGRLTISTDNATLDNDYALAHPGAVPGDYAVLSVSDTGTGMTEEVKARLFEAFFTTKLKGKGTGLGLATCQTIVQQSGGHISVDSELGRGTTFNIYFPRVDLPLDAAARPAKTGPLPRGTETLLVVEDEPALRHLTCGILKAQGYEVLSASNGQDALEMAREYKGGPIHLVVSDVIMPLMDGKVMASWLKAAYPDLKILFTSGNPDEGGTHQTERANSVEFLAKPYAPTALTRKVREMLNANSMRHSSQPSFSRVLPRQESLHAPPAAKSRRSLAETF